METPRPEYVLNFFRSLRLYYVVAFSLSQSYKIAVCPALHIFSDKHPSCIIERLFLYGPVQ